MLQHIQKTEQNSRTGQELGNSFYVTEGKKIEIWKTWIYIEDLTLALENFLKPSL